MASVDKLSIRAGDTKQYVDTLTDTTTGDPVDADLTDGDWSATCQIRLDYATTSEVIAAFEAEITGVNEVTRTLFESESTALDDVPFVNGPTTKRTVYWDAQLRQADGLSAGEDYVVTYRSGTIDILGQVSRDSS